MTSGGDGADGMCTCGRVFLSALLGWIFSFLAALISGSDSFSLMVLVIGTAMGMFGESETLDWRCFSATLAAGLVFFAVSILIGAEVNPFGAGLLVSALMFAFTLQLCTNAVRLVGLAIPTGRRRGEGLSGGAHSV